MTGLLIIAAVCVLIGIGLAFYKRWAEANER